MVQPNQAIQDGFSFTRGENKFYIGFFPFDDAGFSNIPVPKLLHRVGNEDWTEIDTFDALWEDIQSEIPIEIMAEQITKKFNATLRSKFDLEDQGGIELTYTEKLALIFQTRMVFNIEKLELEITPR